MPPSPAEPDAARVHAALREVPLLSSLDDAQLGEAAAGGSCVRLAAGEVIARAGDPADAFYVIVEGRTEWFRTVAGREVHAVTLAAGTCFAELILLLDAPYPTTGRAVTETVLFRLEPAQFWELIHRHRAVLREVVRIAVERAQIHEQVSQQQARLLSLGQLAAGLAHELNNPAAAAARAARDLQGAVPAVEDAVMALVERVGAPQTGRVLDVVRRAPNAVAAVDALDALERSDREDALADWLDAAGVPEPAAAAGELAERGVDVATLDALAAQVPGAALPAAVNVLVRSTAATGSGVAVSAATERISGLVGAMRAFTWLDRDDARQPQDVREGLELALTALSAKTRERGVRVQRRYAPDVPLVDGSGAQLNQAWFALLDNAVDASPHGGRVTVRAESVPGRVLVEVGDEGAGVPDDVADRVFEPFFTTKDVGAGTGLGLDTVRRVVTEHGGEVRFVSSPGDTRFTVRLPLRAQAGVRRG